jgi:hypothetical protein
MGKRSLSPSRATRRLMVRQTTGLERPMLRRAVAITGIAVVLSAACAFAISPRGSRMGRNLGRGLLWIDRGFTPVPSSDRSHPGDSATYQAEGGVPGTFCPIPDRTSSKPIDTIDARSLSEPHQSSSSSEQIDGKNDLLLPTRDAKCTVPVTATPATKSILP